MRYNLSILLVLLTKALSSFVSYIFLAPIPDTSPAAGSAASAAVASPTNTAPAKDDEKKVVPSAEASSDPAKNKGEVSGFQKTLDKIKAKFKELTGDSTSQNTTCALVVLAVTSVVFSLL